MSPPDQTHALLSHLELEADALTEAVAALEDMHRGLRTAGRPGLRAAHRPHEQAAARLESLKRARAALADALREALVSPSPELARAAERVRALARQADALNRSNVLIARRCLAVVQDGLSALCGPPASAVRYGQNGQTTPRTEARLLEARG